MKTVFMAIDQCKTISPKGKQTMKKRVAVNLMVLSPAMHRARAKRIAARRGADA